MTISVVIPAYNIGEYIGRAIDSVLAQTHKPDEIIVVNDGSTDNTAEVIQSYGSKVRYIHQENAGASTARNTGIKAVNCEWIAFLDGDDEWVLDNLQKQTELLKRNPELDWSTANYIRCYCREDRKITANDSKKADEFMGDKDYFESYFSAYMNRTYGCTDTMIIKREVFEKTGLFREKQLKHNDMDMWFRIAFQYSKIGYISQPLAVYHMNVSDSITKRYMDPAILSDFMKRHIEMASEFGKFDEFKPCAEYMLRFWIHRYWLDERIMHIREMAVRFDNVLPKFYTLLLRLLTICPRATQACMPMLSRINKLLRLPL